MDSPNTTGIQRIETAATYGAASLAAFLIGSLCQLAVVDWLIFGSPDGPLWVGFFAPLGLLLYVAGCGVALIGRYRTRCRKLSFLAALNAALICAFFGACFAYVVFALSIEHHA
ncbi:hypothetical protein OT109_01180 [Phycisphaeraceae bacterium D3-23]